MFTFSFKPLVCPWDIEEMWSRHACRPELRPKKRSASFWIIWTKSCNFKSLIFEVKELNKNCFSGLLIHQLKLKKSTMCEMSALDYFRLVRRMCAGKKLTGQLVYHLKLKCLQHLKCQYLRIFVLLSISVRANNYRAKTNFDLEREILAVFSHFIKVQRELIGDPQNWSMCFLRNDLGSTSRFYPLLDS